jgi:short-subunit dehydrogenase
VRRSFLFLQGVCSPFFARLGDCLNQLLFGDRRPIHRPAIKGTSAPASVLITGATGGLGGGLATVYAEPGRTLILQGRNADRLQELAAICEARGARVLTQLLDLRDGVALAAWLGELSRHEALDLVIVNAGVNTHAGADGEGERWQDVQELLAVNIVAAIATVDAVLPAMRARGKGQIALMSSLAAYYGLPVTPSYCASKAALKSYGEAMRGSLAATGVRVSVIMPGYVESRMCREMPGPKPFVWSPERAGRYIRRALERNQSRISFPFPLNLGTWCLAMLPPSLSERILRWLAYGG